MQQRHKLDKNKLNKRIQVLVRDAMPIAKIVEDYTNRHPDIEYSGIVAQVLSRKYYSLLEGESKDANSMFFSLIDFVYSTREIDQDKFFWASVGIVSHYFELCDIFER